MAGVAKSVHRSSTQCAVGVARQVGQRLREILGIDQREAWSSSLPGMTVPKSGAPPPEIYDPARSRKSPEDAPR
jgi:hypothetical protein